MTHQNLFLLYLEAILLQMEKDKLNFQKVIINVKCQDYGLDI